jgi:endonuclease YncB( thermonuclease family)
MGMGTNRRRFVQALAACGLAFPAARYHGFAQGLPDGVPENAQKATVTDHVDGDKYVVDVDGAEFTVLMISADAPEMGKCFYTPSVKHLESLIPVGTTVYLERDGDATDKKGRLLCYTWKPREGKTAQFIDERMIADGCALFKSRDGHTTRDKRLSKAQETAKQHKRGIWADGACDPTANRTPTPAPTPMEGIDTPLGYTVVSSEDS